MQGFADFLAMGGRGAFVWSAYFVAAVVLAGLFVQSLRSLRRRERMLGRLRDARRGPEYGRQEYNG